MTSPPRVSMEITDEMLKSMEVGLAFRDYVSSLSYLSPQFICLSIVGQTLRCCLIMGESGGLWIKTPTPPTITPGFYGRVG